MLNAYLSILTECIGFSLYSHFSFNIQIIIQCQDICLKYNSNGFFMLNIKLFI